MVSQKDLKILSCLFELADKQKSITIEELAERFEISSRTVRNNLDRIDYYLKSNGLHPLKRDRKNGIMLDIEADEIEECRRSLTELNTETYVFSKEERILYLKLLLFDTEEYLTYDQLSQELFVSRKTVIDDVHLVKEDCEKRGIHLLGTKRGLKYSGREFKLRELITDSLLEKYTPLELWEILRDIYPNKSIIIEKKWRGIVEDRGIRICEDALRAAEQQEKASITDAQYYMIVILSVLALKRKDRVGAALLENRPGISKIPRYLQNYFSAMEREKTLDFGKEEEGWLLLEIDRIFNLENQEKSEALSLALAENILLEVSRRTKKPYFNDTELRFSLQKHLMSLIENSFVCYEADGENIKAISVENPLLYGCIQECLSQFPEIGPGIDCETESALLLLHFLAADERSYIRNSVNYSTVIVCNNGVGTAKIVSARIKQYFPQIQIVSVTAVRNAAGEITENRPDFIISTVPFEYQNLPVILINTLPTEDDLKKIRIFLGGNGKRTRQSSDYGIYGRVMEAILETCEIKDMEGLKKRLGRIFPVEEKHPELLDGLTEKEIQLQLDAKNWEDAIRMSAAPLVREGYITPGYVDCMVNNVKTMGPYIVITKGIALPHALLADGVLRSCISLATLKTPVSFGNKINDPVRLVICIATADKKEHMREMSKLIRFISDKEAVCMVNRAEKPAEVLEIVHKRYPEGGRKEA